MYEDRVKVVFKSPLNYVGGKFKLLPTLLPKLPLIKNRFVDLFCGGGNVSININAKKLLLNDNCCHLVNLFIYLRSQSVAEVLGGINRIVEEFSISKTNQEGFLLLRKSCNQEYDPLKFLVLVSNSFNHQIRFNSSGGFNMPFGHSRSYFNERMKKNLSELMHVFHAKDFEYTCQDFRDVELDPSDFVYCDPPYNTRWREQEDADLCYYLDSFHFRGGKFALSYVLQENHNILSKWAKKYQTHALEWKYNNSNHHKTDVALIVNYEV